MDTQNPNTWESGTTNMASSAAHIRLVQETRENKVKRIPQLSKNSRAMGWNTHFAIADTTEANSSSAGVDISANKTHRHF